MKKAFSYSDAKSNKFWWIECLGSELVVNYGKTGATGKYQIKEFDSDDDCLKEANKLITQKTKKGYLEDPNFSFDQRFYFDDEEVGLHPLTSHPNFRSHFADDLYYDCGDEEAPFGSDEGSDTLAELTETVRKKGEINFDEFPKYLINKVWEMNYIPVDSIEEDAVKKVLELDEMNLIQSDMVTYATAFAQIKITGAVDEQLKANAINAMKRMSMVSKFQGFEHSEISEMMIKDLLSFDKIKK